MSTITAGLGSLLTEALASAFNGGSIRIFAGAMPATPELAETGTLLGIVTVNGVTGAGLHYTSQGTVLSKAALEQWVFTGLASNTAAWFRVVTLSDTGADDPNAVRIQGQIGTALAPSDMVWTDTTVVQGTPYTLDSFAYMIQPIG